MYRNCWMALEQPLKSMDVSNLYDGLGNNADVRQHAYRELFKTRILDEDIHAIKNSLDYNHPLGNERFKDQIEKALGRAVGQGQRGRPKELYVCANPSFRTSFILGGLSLLS